MPATDVTIKPTYRKIAIIDDDNAKEIVYPKTVDKLVLITRTAHLSKIHPNTITAITEGIRTQKTLVLLREKPLFNISTTLIIITTVLNIYYI